MNDSYFAMLKDIYSSSDVITVLADQDFKVQWINDEALFQQNFQKSALCFFEEGASIPAASGEYSGVCNGVMYSYNVILYRHTEQTLFIIEMNHQDTVMEALRNPTVIRYLSDVDAGIRQAVFSISGSASNLFDVLEATESYNEIGLVNTQMRECYKILKAIQLPNEILKYVYDVMDTKVIELSGFLDGIQETFLRILQDRRACLSVEFEKELFVRADEERLRYMLLDMILYIIKHSQGCPCAVVSAKRVAKDILISVTPGDYIPEVSAPWMPAYSQGAGRMGAAFADTQDTDLYIIRKFCDRFDAKMYVVSGKDGGTAIGVRLPFAEKYEDPPGGHLQSGLGKYQADKFSPFHIGLADIYNFNFFDHQ